jgi:hypothetical protein
MKHLCLAIVFVFASFRLLSAQNNSAGSPPNNHNAHTSTIRGCLGGTAGAYTLASSGTTYELMGNEELLSRVVGKEVKIAGTKESASDVSGGMPGDGAGAASDRGGGTEPTIRVSSVTILSNHCGSGR